jgi:chitinase
LSTYCDDPAIDIIPVAFITLFPPQANGLVQENFADKCQGGNLYPGPGYDGVNNPNNNLLYEICPDVQQDIWYCQTQTDTKILLSLGGSVGAGVTPYELNSPADGVYLANILWGMYGPIDQGFNADWVSSGSYRPLDRGTNNATAGVTIDIDGFDFDIEVGSTSRFTAPIYDPS